jgi:hypothetical protein
MLADGADANAAPCRSFGGAIVLVDKDNLNLTTIILLTGS